MQRFGVGNQFCRLTGNRSRRSTVAFTLLHSTLDDPGRARDVGRRRVGGRPRPARRRVPRQHGNDRNAQWHSDIAVTPDGTFFVVWDTTTDNPDGSGGAIFAQRYDSSGNLIGTEFQVNAYTTGDQCCARVSAADDGTFVVVWQDGGRDGHAEGVFGRRFDAVATPVGSEFQVNAYTTGIQWDIDVAAANDGRFVVVWADDDQLGGRVQINGRRFDNTATPLGTQFRVNTYTTGDKIIPYVDSASDGSFIVAWDSAGQDSSGFGVFARRYDSSGSPLGTDMQVSQYTTGDQTVGDVSSTSDGRFVIGFSSPQDGDNLAAMVRRYDSSGAPLGAAFQVNTYTTNVQGLSSLSVAPDGSFVAIWNGFGSQDGDGSGVFGQAYDAAGAAAGTEFQVNSYTTGGIGKQSIAIKDSSDDTKDQLKWKWGKGAATDFFEFASPDFSTAQYTLCVYDGSAAPQPLLQASIPPGGEVPICGASECWKATGTTGFKYKNKIGKDRSINAVRLKAGAGGKAQVQVKAKGSLLQPPPTGGLTNVVVQFLIDDGVTTECFKTTFPNAGITTQDGDDFKAKGP